MAPSAHSLKVKTLLTLALGAITLALYLPALRHDFLAYDDQQYVTENPHVQGGLTAKGVVWAFGFHVSNWHPLTWISHMVDCQVYGLRPGGHHLTNALLHAATTVLLFLVLSGMTGTLWRSAIVAALFGWHPLHVESVAWVAERKDLLCAFFFVLTLGAYAKYVARRTASFYALALFFFALGIMSKPMVVTLPFVLLLLDYWPLERIRLPVTDYRSLFRVVLEKVPFLVFSIVACVLTIKAQSQAYAVVSTAGLPISNRIAHTMISYAHYVSATLLPTHLAVYYPYETAIPATKLVAACLILVIISVLTVCCARKLRYLLVGWLWFLGMLVPVIGLVQVGEQAWADRYTYLPSIGLFIATVWGFAQILQPRSHGAVGTPRPSFVAMVGRGAPTAPIAIAFVIGSTLLILTSIQLRFWKNTRTLFEHAAAVTQENYLAVTLLGSLLAKEGKLDEAIVRYKIALGWKPGYSEAHFFLGNALDQGGKLDAAIAEYKQALRFKPMQEQTHILLGVALAKKQQLDEAAGHYREALKLNPESAVAHNKLARALQTQGRLDEAMEHYSAALQLDPGLAQAHNNLGVLMLARARVADGVRELRQAVQLSPADVESEYNLALALSQEEQWAEAAELLAKVAQKRPGDPNTHYHCAVALKHLGKTREAMSHYANALLIQPDFPDALDGLAWILATSDNPAFRNGTEAVRMAERACQLTGRKSADKLRTLAGAYAETGRFPEARTTIGSATELFSQRHLTNLTNICQLMLEKFESEQPWRDTDIK